ncbi:MAG: hypothetical protein ACRCTP_04645 [Aeromonas popoffii]|uniref:hypothetical protein n=1 Tax=Aeromonas popoffii TaxID=70856 RepID=UPI003F394FD5
MDFTNAIHRNDFERLQIELLRAEVSLKKEKAEEQRIANVIQRTLHRIPEKILPAPMPAAAPTGFWGGQPANNHNSLY